jgi:hypothetical protein
MLDPAAAIIAGAIDFIKRFGPQPSMHRFSNGACERKASRKDSSGFRGSAHNHTSAAGVCYGFFEGCRYLSSLLLLER